ncbi:MAG: damage-inducible protein DinB [Treponema sp.]|jgi:uncharacterized damage-inducible protein DinB|nr:damage-inducible protein DinB [Treponema sp.]
MKELLVIFAKQNEEADKAFVSILDKMGNDEREKNRKSYYGSLSGLARHILGGTFFFLGKFREAVEDNAAALKALAGLVKVETFRDVKKLDEAQWKKLCSGLKIADKAYVQFVSALSDKDLEKPIQWFGKPATTPLFFALQSLVAHNIHHRGQISQILDELKIDNDYSGINAKFLG